MLSDVCYYGIYTNFVKDDDVTIYNKKIWPRNNNKHANDYMQVQLYHDIFVCNIVKKIIIQFFEKENICHMHVDEFLEFTMSNIDMSKPSFITSA